MTIDAPTKACDQPLFKTMLSKPIDKSLLGWLWTIACRGCLGKNTQLARQNDKGCKGGDLSIRARTRHFYNCLSNKGRLIHM